MDRIELGHDLPSYDDPERGQQRDLSDLRGFFCGSSGMTVQFGIIDANNALVGSWFYRTFVPNEFVSFNPFNQAGVPYPTYSYSNCWLYINPTAGSGYLYCYGASANNTTNDPASLIAVQFQ
jgi:hypothetical protein